MPIFDVSILSFIHISRFYLDFSLKKTFPVNKPYTWFLLPKIGEETITAPVLHVNYTHLLSTVVAHYVDGTQPRKRTLNIETQDGRFIDW